MRACLAKYLKRPRRIGSICVGAFILADLGVLDSREATTHWQVCSGLSGNSPYEFGQLSRMKKPDLQSDNSIPQFCPNRAIFRNEK